MGPWRPADVEGIRHGPQGSEPRPGRGAGPSTSPCAPARMLRRDRGAARRWAALVAGDARPRSLVRIR